MTGAEAHLLHSVRAFVAIPLAEGGWCIACGRSHFREILGILADDAALLAFLRENALEPFTWLPRGDFKPSERTTDAPLIDIDLSDLL